MQVTFNAYALPFLIGFHFNAILAIIVFLQNPKNPTNRLLASLMAVLAAWNMCDMLYTVAANDAIGVTFGRIACSVTTLIPAIYLHFVMVYPSKKAIMNRRAVYALIYGPAAAFIYLIAFTDKLVAGPLKTAWAAHYYFYGPEVPYYAAYFAVYFLAAILILSSVLTRSQNRRERFQSKWFIAATLVPIFGGISSNLVLPMLGLVIFPVAGPLTILTALMISYAMFRYRIMSTSLQSASEIIISMLPGIVVYLGPDQRIISGNKRFFEMLGYTEQELEGEPIMSILSEESKRAGLPLQRWEEKGQVKSQRLVFRTKDGGSLAIDFTGTIVTDEINDIIGLVGMGFPEKGSR